MVPQIGRFSSIGRLRRLLGYREQRTFALFSEADATALFFEFDQLRQRLCDVLANGEKLIRYASPAFPAIGRSGDQLQKLLVAFIHGRPRAVVRADDASAFLKRP